jgi:hypothetical protein
VAGGSKRGDAGLPRLLVPLDLAVPELEKLIREGSYLRGYAGMYDRRVPATPRNEAKRHEQWERLIAEAESWSRHTPRGYQPSPVESELMGRICSRPKPASLKARSRVPRRMPGLRSHPPQAVIQRHP